MDGCMKNRIIIGLLFIFIPSVLLASEMTPNYRLEIPSIGQQDWQAIISNDIMSTDTIMGIMSEDITLGNPILTSNTLKIQILSNDAVNQDTKLAILSNDAVIQNVNLNILSNDAVIQNTKISILSNDAVIQDVKLAIISNDAVVMKQAGIAVYIGGAQSVILTGDSSVMLEVPFNCTIVSACLVVQPSGTMSIDIWKDTYDNYPPTDADSICPHHELLVTSGAKSMDGTLIGWTTSLVKGDIMIITADAVNTVQDAMVSLKVNKR
jgi:hypothetical protein